MEIENQPTKQTEKQNPNQNQNSSFFDIVLSVFK